MSIHILNANVTDQLLQVQMGWDSPMKWFYLVVSPVNKDGELEDPVYSNLNESDPKSKTLAYYLDVCQRLGIIIPDKMIAGVKEDRETGAMNRKIEY